MSNQYLFLSPDRGVRVHVRRSSGETIDGWIFDSSQYELLVALDPDGNEVRWLPNDEDGLFIEFLYEEPRANFTQFNQDQLAELQNRLAEPVTQLLTTTDLNGLRRVGIRLFENTALLERFIRQAQVEPTPTWLQPEMFVEARASFAELLSLLNQSAASQVLQIVDASPLAGPFLASSSLWERLILPSETVQFIDDLSSIATWGATETSFDSAQTLGRTERTNVEVAFSIERLAAWNQDRVMSVTERLLGPTGDDSMNPGKGKRFRWAEAWSKTITGGLLVAVDLAGGGASVLGGPLVIAGAIAPVAASVYKGGNLVAKGFHQMGDIADGLDAV